MPRVKPHTKIHLSAKSHRKTAELWQDNDLLACWVRLLDVAMERYAAKNDNVVILNRTQVIEITGKKRFDSAKKLLDYLASTSPVVVEYLGSTVQVHVPKFAEKQGIGRKNVAPQRAESREQKAESREQKEKPPSGGLCLCPESLSDGDWEKLSAWARTVALEDHTRAAFQRVHDWSHTSKKKRTRWWVMTKNAMQDGWALQGSTGNGAGPKSFAEQQMAFENDTPRNFLEKHYGEALEDELRDCSTAGGSRESLPERHRRGAARLLPGSSGADES